MSSTFPFSVFLLPQRTAVRQSFFMIKLYQLYNPLHCLMLNFEFILRSWKTATSFTSDDFVLTITTKFPHYLTPTNTMYYWEKLQHHRQYIAHHLIPTKTNQFLFYYGDEKKKIWSPTNTMITPESNTMVLLIRFSLLGRNDFIIRL